MFAYRDARGPVEVAFTDRDGGVSTGPWSSLNLGTSNGDQPGRVEHNLGAVADAFGVASDRMVRMSQHHGCTVGTVDDSTPQHGTDADALVTRTRDLALLVRVADCTPVVLGDADQGVVGVVHAGRRGLDVGVVGSAMAAMRRLGARTVTAWVGPRACGRCYEVSAEIHDHVGARVPAARSTTRRGTPALDVGAGVLAQLAAEGVDDVRDLAATMPACTIEHEQRYFSYRRQGSESGRLGALVTVRG